jgi:predicted HTH transcriptional regulator
MMSFWMLRRGIILGFNKVLKEMGFIEQWGTGIGRILAESKTLGVKEPVFEEIGQSFRVTIYGLQEY